jgi:hypothetical protein
MKRLAIVTFLAGILHILLSCDPSDFKLPAHQVDLIVPIFDIDLSIADLILTDSANIIQEDSTGFVHLHYDITESRSLEDIAPIDDTEMDFDIPGIPGDIPDFTINIPIAVQLLGIDTGYYAIFDPAAFNYDIEADLEKFIKADFEGGFIGIEITNNFPFILNNGLVIELINKEESTPFVDFILTQNLNPGESFLFQDEDLVGKYLSGTFTFRIKDLMTPGETDINIKPEDALDFSISYKNIILFKATFEQPDVELPGLYIDVPLIFPNGARITRGRLDSGQFVLEVPEIEEFLLLKLTFPTALQDEEPISFLLGNKRIEVSLHNLEIDLSTTDIGYNFLPLELQLVFNESIETFDIEFNKSLSGSLKFYDIDYDYLVGYLGKGEELLDEAAELPFFQSVRSGTMVFDDPIITISISNGVGATGTIRDDGEGLYIRGSNEKLYGDQVVTFGESLEGLTLAPAPFPGNPETTTYILDGNNEPDFSNFLSLFPTYLEVRIPVETGTDEIIMDQFLEDDAIIRLDLGLEIPLNLSADRFIVADTTEFRFELDFEKYDVQYAIVHTRFESYFPLELSFQTLFLDESFELIDSLFKESKIIEPAVIGADGKVTDPLVEEFLTEFEKEELDLFRTIAWAVPIIRLHTPEGQFVQLFSSYTLKIKTRGELITDIYWDK